MAVNLRRRRALGIAAELVHAYTWYDAKCSAGCEGQFVTEGLSHVEEVIDGVFVDGSSNIEIDTWVDWQHPRTAEIVLHWRIRDAFGFATWDEFSPEVHAAFEAYLLAREVPAGYAYARTMSAQPSLGPGHVIRARPFSCS